MIECVKCGHKVHKFSIDTKGRCGSCHIDIVRRWEHRKEVRNLEVDLWEPIKIERNRLLSLSDWTQLPDVPESTKSLWLSYRQQLRDITEQPDPTNVIWPDRPIN